MDGRQDHRRGRDESERERQEGKRGQCAGLEDGGLIRGLGLRVQGQGRGARGWRGGGKQLATLGDGGLALEGLLGLRRRELLLRRQLTLPRGVSGSPPRGAAQGASGEEPGERRERQWGSGEERGGDGPAGRCPSPSGAPAVPHPR